MKRFLLRSRSPGEADPQHRATVLKPYAQPLSRGGRAGVIAAMAGLLMLCIIYGFYYALTTPFLLKEFIAPLVPLGCLVIWVLPESNRVPERALAGLLWSLYVATMLWPPYLAVDIRGLPWISAARLTGLPLATLLLVTVSQSAMFRRQTAASVAAVPHLMTLMCAFAAILVFSILVSDQRITSANTVFDNLISWIAVFFAAAWFFLKPGRAHLWAALMCAASVALCLIGLWEARLEHPVWTGHVPPIFNLSDEYVQRALQGSRRLGMEYRVQATQSTPLGLAEHLALATPFFLHFMLGPFKMKVRVAAAIAIPLVFFVILLTRGRLGMVGFFLAGLLYLLFWAVKRWRDVRGTLLGPAIVAAYPAVFCAFVAASFFIGRLKAIVWGNGATAASNDARQQQIIMGIPLIFKRPWGYGDGRGADFLNYSGPSGILTIDNYFLNAALDWGVQGFLVYYGMVLLMIWTTGKQIFAGGMRNREHTYLIPATIALTEFFVIKSIFSQTHNHKWVFMMMGMMCALLYRIRYGVAEDPLPPASGPYPSGEAFNYPQVAPPWSRRG